MAGYSGTPLPRKLGIKPGHLVALLDAPEEVRRALGAVPGVTTMHALDGGEPLDVIVTFLRWREDFEASLPALRQRMAPACGLWVA